MPETTIDIFMIDPPWPKSKGGLRSARPNQTRSLDYSTLSVEECFGLLDSSILPLAAETHNVFMWTIDQFLHDAEQQMTSRGYKRHARIIWDKTNGVAPAFTVRYTHEYLLWFYRPRLAQIDSAVRGKYTTVIRETARQHSRKPDAAYDMVAKLYPFARRLDVFSREGRAGWEQWGNQTDHFSD